MVTDEEQVEDLKKWWQRNGRHVTTGAVIGLAAVLGLRAWWDYQERQRLSASTEYEQFQAEFSQGNTDAVLRRGNYLIENYSGTPYAVIAALTLAKVHVDRGELPAAKQQLQWVVDKAKAPELVHIARLRLARVIAAEGDPAAAIKVLESVDAGMFAASYDELKGDLYVAAGDRDQARAAYRKAIAELNSGAGSDLVQMKLDDLGAEG